MNVRGQSCVVLMNILVQTKQIIEKMMIDCYLSMETWAKRSIASLSISSKGNNDSCLKITPVYISFFI